MKVIIGSDHVGVEMLSILVEYLTSKNIEVKKSNIVNHSTDDYTDFAFEIGEGVNTNFDLGILICGNGIGMSIAANKVKGIRCARVLSKEDAFKCKNHNGANVISLSSEIDIDLTKEIVDTFLETPTPTEERYLRRVQKMLDYERNNN